MQFCSIASGSSGNSIFVGSKHTGLLIDAGLSGKKIEQSLQSIQKDPKNLDAILITHEHHDHIKAAGILSRRLNLPIYATLKTWHAMEKDIGIIKAYHKKIIYAGEPFIINDLHVLAFPIPHDAADPVAFCIQTDRKKICIGTDIGHITGTIMDHLYDSDLILIEANHDLDMLKQGSYPYHLKKRISSGIGHLSNVATANVLNEIMSERLHRIFLGHLSEENNSPQLAFQTVNDLLIKKHGKLMKQKKLEVLSRYQVGPLVQL